MVAKNNVNVGVLLRRLAIAVIILLVIWIIYTKFYVEEQEYQSVKGQKVNVTVFYEVLCPDSRHFVLRQLYPTWEKVPEIMDINYRPFGKAYITRKGDDYEFQCQHGPTECEGNIVHNCAVKYVQESLLMPYINCMMKDNYEPLKIGKTCAEMLDLDWPAIKKCATSREGQELMAKVGYESLGVKNRLSFIPTIALNGDYENQSGLLKNLLAGVCDKFNGPRPENCIQVV